MNVVVTGGSGFVGRKLVERLLAGGHAVTVWSRAPDRLRGRLPAAAAVVRAEPAGADPDLLAGVDCVVNLAGESIASGRWTAARKRAIRASRVDGTSALATALAALPPSRRPAALISASAIGYYGDRGDERLDESAGPGDGFLADVCRDWEKAASRAAEAGVRVACLRVGVVLGRGGGALARMLPLFRRGLGGRLGDGRQWMSWIHLDDVAALFAFAVERGDVHGAVNAVAPGAVRNRDFSDALAAAVGRRAPLPVPALVLRLLLGEMSEALLGSQRVEPRVAADLGFAFAHPELAGALADLCARPSA